MQQIYLSNCYSYSPGGWIYIYNSGIFKSQLFSSDIRLEACWGTIIIFDIYNEDHDYSTLEVNSYGIYVILSNCSGLVKSFSSKTNFGNVTQVEEQQFSGL